MGILDSKTRVMDTIVTLEGRRQLASGKMRIEYASFTDGGAFYERDIVSGSSDATTRLYLETASVPQDRITLEADDAGMLLPFPGTQGAPGGRLVEHVVLTSSGGAGPRRSVDVLTGEAFASQAHELLNASVGHFTSLRLIGTRDALFEDEGFAAGGSQVEFVITDERPLPDPMTHVANINALESLHQDVRLSSVPNFWYLPPINRLDDASVDKADHRQTWEHQLGHYPPWGRTQVDGLPPAQLESELAHYESMGYARTVTFDPTSRDNNLVGQAFELLGDQLRKLDVIDYGPYAWNGSHKRAFFVGRVITDDNGSSTFVHIFTLVFG